MKRKYIWILSIYLVLLSVSMIRLVERQRVRSITPDSENREITRYTDVLAKDSIVYIPNYGMVLYKVDPEPENISIEPFEPKHKRPWITKAFYNLHYFSLEEIEDLLYSTSPNLRIYGYIYYMKKTKNVNFNYLLYSQKDKTTINLIFEERWVYGECYVSDLLLLLALKEENLPHYLIENGLTDSQKNILKSVYEKRKPINPYMDQLIRYYFDYEWDDN